MVWPRLLKRSTGVRASAESAATLPPRTSGVLRQLSSEDRFGEVEIRAEDPGLHVAEDVLFAPDAPGGRWGMFDPHGEPLTASLDHVFPWSQLMYSKPVSPVAWSEVQSSLPDSEYLYIGFVHGHFGHVLIDSLSRLWPVLDGGLNGRKLLHHGLGNWETWANERPWLTDILSGLGLGPSDFVRVVEPVRVRRVVIPGRSWQGQTFAHAAHGRLCRHIGAALLADTPVASGPPVYLSKTKLAGGGVRRVVNEGQLESFLRARGVEVLYPETLSLREQLALFAADRTVAGTTTSAFHLSLFAPPAGRVVGVESTTELNSNHLMVDRLNGNDAVYLHPLGSRRVSEHTDGWMAQDAFRDPVAVGRELLHWL